MRHRDPHKEAAIRTKAIEIIVTRGFDGLSMQNLASEANISPGTIYIYFKDREDLLNRLFTGVQDKFENDVLQGFSPDASFEEGLWQQWKNRLKNIRRSPLEFQFYEQFRNSALIRHKDIQPGAFRRAMHEFVDNAVKRGEIRQLPTEVFWAVAYGPFYTLVQFHLANATMAGLPFSLTERKLEQAFELVIQALKKVP